MVSSTSLRVAVAQQEPEWLDLQASVKKVCRVIAEAAENKAKIVTFSEAFIPGYPAWIWYNTPSSPSQLH
jgi:predicted amidohydrolase